MEKKVFFVDDEPMIRKAVAMCLDRIDAEVTCFAGAQSCLESIASCGCDVLVTDINMPEMDGIALIQHVAAKYPRMPIIAITGFGDVNTAVTAMKAGAVDFIEKPLNESNLVKAVASALQDSCYHPETLLTTTEERILSHVVAGRTNKEIATLLERSVRTVENHRHRISKKLDASSTAELVRKALEMGVVPASD